ncbi:type II secretion system F family protein [Schaalia suimastitidis]|uniref:type II secretion system F family protein n=1 Tax=Schaalia suimastitidis TaxID=121163 RepID=UPI000686C6A6|nr:type II secretion system F family protein [Schaalia suimastitidis]
MSENLLSVVFALGVCGGIILIIAAVRLRYPSLAQRVAQAQPQAWSPSGSASRRLPTWLTSVLETIGSTHGSVERRLTLLGSPDSVVNFRLQQVGIAVVTSALSATMVAPLLWSKHPERAVLLLLLGVTLGALAGAALVDWLLSVRAKARQKAIEQQVPDASELMALAVSAGESVPDALARVARACSSPIAGEFHRAVRHIHLGESTTQALADLAARNDSPALDRLARTLIAAIERGSPLTQILHDQARDIREHSRAALMEEGGKREIAMLFPVVFLILPITVLFALYPGLVALSFSP